MARINSIESPEPASTSTRSGSNAPDLAQDELEGGVGRDERRHAGGGEDHGEALGDEGVTVDDDDAAPDGVVARRPRVMVVVDHHRGADALDVGSG